MSRISPIPDSPGARLLKLGRLAGGIAAGMAAEGVRQLSSGSLPNPADLLLTPQNAARLAERLSDLRGAAMKVGQLLSMEAGDLLPPELSAVLSRLREDAHQMPLGQVASVLEQAWGEDWPKRFKRFNFQPLAAASIGQVHEAFTKSGRHLAIKIQYPGIRNSIDSDVDNVARLLSLVRALPDQTDVSSLLSEAKRQLQEEANYMQEAEKLEIYRGHLGDHPLFVLPEVVHQWTTPEVLSMSYLSGESLDRLESEPRATRNHIAKELMQLAIRELFDWGLVQTDPNFANYRYDRQSGKIGLLDFGAVRRYGQAQVDILRNLLTASITKDREAVLDAAVAAGYTDPADPPAYQEGVVALLLDATEPARHPGDYDFGGSSLAARMSENVMAMRFESRCWRILNDPVLRENFVSRVLVYRRWQDLLKQGLSAKGLVAFHAAHKYMVMAHSQAANKRLGRMLSDLKGKHLPEVTGEYIAELMAALKRRCNRDRHVNVLQHMMGYLKKRLDGEDKRELMEAIEAYRRGEVPLIFPIFLLRHHFRHHPDPYMESQWYLDPYPAALGLRNNI